MSNTSSKRPWLGSLLTIVGVVLVVGGLVFLNASVALMLEGGSETAAIGFFMGAIGGAVSLGVAIIGAVLAFIGYRAAGRD